MATSTFIHGKSRDFKLIGQGDDGHVVGIRSCTMKNSLRHKAPGVSVLAVLMFGMTFWTATARAESSIDQCNDVLKQDLFNRITSTTQTSQSAKQAYTESLFKMEDDKALSEYKNAYASYQAQKTTGS